MRHPKLYLLLAGIAAAALSFSTYVYLFSSKVLTFDPPANSPAVSSSVITPEFSILFIGDMMFDRGVRAMVNSHSYAYVFGDSPKIFEGNQSIVGNLEGPITSSPSKTLLPSGAQVPEFLTFTFPPETAPALRQNGIGMVTLANNHEENFGKAGIKSTRNYLNAAGVRYFGDPENNDEIATTTCMDSICVGLIGYHQFSNPDDAVIVSKIHELRSQVDFIVVFPHWGEEYNIGTVPSQVALAHHWIDEGADLIIGAHPHVIEPIETYKGKTIFYSLGNYIFDQYFSFNTTHGIAAKITFKKDSYSYDIIPIQNTGITVRIPDATTTSRILDSIRKNLRET